MTHIRLGLELGRGAQGVVYSGITHLGEKVAVKVSPVDHSQTARELRAVCVHLVMRTPVARLGATCPAPLFRLFMQMKLFAEAGVNHTHLISWRLPPLERPFYRQILQVIQFGVSDGGAVCRGPNIDLLLGLAVAVPRCWICATGT